VAVSIVLPVYNSEATLRPSIARISTALGGCGPLEVILVNDCSRDESWRVIRELAAEYAWIRGLNLMRNFGQHNALLCGIRLARYPVTVTMDDDLQNPPEEAPQLLHLNEGHDVVYGAPLEEAHGFLRNVASKVTKAALKTAMGAVNARNVSAFRAFRTNLRDVFKFYEGPSVSIDVLLTWGTTRFSFVRVRNDKRNAGVSNYTVKKLMVHVEYDDRLQHTAFEGVELRWLRVHVLRRGGAALPGASLLHLGQPAAGISLSGLHHHDLRRRAVIYSRNHGRISGANPCPDHEPAKLCRL